MSISIESFHQQVQLESVYKKQIEDAKGMIKKLTEKLSNALSEAQKAHYELMIERFTQEVSVVQGRLIEVREIISQLKQALNRSSG